MARKRKSILLPQARDVHGSINREGRRNVRRILLATLILTAGGVFVMARQRRPDAAMAGAAKALLGMLTQEQAAKIRWSFDSEERFNWHFVPRERKGLSFKDMTEPQRKAAFDLLRTGLSAKGFTKVETIRSLEVVLRAVEKSARRDPELYFFTIFGEPGQTRGAGDTKGTTSHRTGRSSTARRSRRLPPSSGQTPRKSSRIFRALLRRAPGRSVPKKIWRARCWIR